MHIDKEVTEGPLEKNPTRNTDRSCWINLDTDKELENCSKRLDLGIAKNRRIWALQQKADRNNFEKRSQLARTWEKLLQEYFETEMRFPSQANFLIANPFVSTEGKFLFA